jgi:Zn-dependent M32 family carboxypeptidase
MSNESNTPKDSAIVEVVPEGQKIATTSEAEPKSADELKEATEALISAIKNLAKSEMEAAGDFSREAYLKAVGQARKNIEQIKLIDPDEFEKSFVQVQTEAEKNWKTVLKEMQDFGDRFTKAAQAAWDVLTAPKKDDEAPKE